MRDGSGRLRPVNQYYRGHEVYFESRYYVLGGLGAEVVLQAGDHSYPFSTVLPDVLPTSFEGQMGHVRYVVWITLERPWKYNHDVKAAFTVINPLDLNEEPQLQEPVELSENKYFGFWCCRSGPVNLTVKVPTAGFVPGQEMPVTVAVENKSRKAISNVELDLAKVTSFHAKLGGRSKTRINITEVLGRYLGAIEPDGSNSWMENIRVPSLPPSGLRNCNIIDLSYILTVSVEIAGEFKRLETHSDIVIGTVPLKRFWPVLAVIPLTPPPIVGSDGELLPQESRTETPSPYPELPPPMYVESILGPGNIRDPTDNEWLRGNLGFAPRYPSFNFDK
ncbi:arrestin domain-containing protein 17 isoform X2 [Anabrus simplex]